MAPSIARMCPVRPWTKRMHLNTSTSPSPRGSRLGGVRFSKKNVEAKKRRRGSKFLACCPNSYMEKGFPNPMNLLNLSTDAPAACHLRLCDCPCGPVHDYQLREFKNATLPVYRYCRACGTRSQSPVPRTTIRLQKWRELLIASGREVR